MTEAVLRRGLPHGAVVEGFCDPRFAGVRDAFIANFIDRDEIGASVAVTVDGKPVVDLWGGYKDARRQKRWDRETIVCVQSVTKEVTALMLHMLVDRGLVDVDAPAARYWPNFAQQGKATLPVRWLLDHRAGLPVVDGAWRGMAYDWKAMTEGLAATKPMWEPGTTPCYHASSYGHLVGEIVRRVSGKMPGRFFRDEIGGPLGIDFHIGLAEADLARCADYLKSLGHENMKAVASDPNHIFAKMWTVFHEDEDFNSRDWRLSEIPAVNGHGNARALARLAGALSRGGELDGVRLLSEKTLAKATVSQWEGIDVGNRHWHMAQGFLLPHAGSPMGPSPRAFGMSGAGGHTVIIDPDNRIGFAYTMNRMEPSATQRPRARALAAATFAAID